MNKEKLYQFFEEKISKSAIQKRDNDWIISGKWSIVSVWDDGLIDIWLCDAKNLPLGMLGERKLTNIITGLEKISVKSVFHRLTGEAYTQTLDKEVVLLNLNLLGIRRKRQVSKLGGFFKDKLFSTSQGGE